MAETPHITVKLPQLSPYPLDTILPEDLIYVWEVATGILRNARVNQMPFGSGGGGGQPALGSPFKVRFGEEGVIVIDNGDGTFNTKVSDVRLLGKLDYPVNSSQVNNGVYRDDELIYNSTEGSVTILGLNLSLGEVVVLYPDGLQTGGGSGGSLQGIFDRLDELERKAAPFNTSITDSGGGRVIWGRPANEIPIGWVEDIDYRGKFLRGADPTVTEINESGKVGGSTTYKLTQDNIPEHRFFTAIGGTYSSSNFPPGLDGINSLRAAYNKSSGAGKESYYLSGDSGSEPNVSRTNKYGKANNDSIDLTNPFRTVNVIKYVGI